MSKKALFLILYLFFYLYAGEKIELPGHIYYSKFYVNVFGKPPTINYKNIDDVLLLDVGVLFEFKEKLRSSIEKNIDSIVLMEENIDSTALKGEKYVPSCSTYTYIPSAELLIYLSTDPYNSVDLTIFFSCEEYNKGYYIFERKIYVVYFNKKFAKELYKISKLAEKIKCIYPE